MATSSNNVMKKLSPDSSMLELNELETTLTMDDIESFFSETLSKSPVNLNEEMLKNTDPCEINKSLIALAITRTINENKELKRDLADLSTSFKDFKAQCEMDRLEYYNITEILLRTQEKLTINRSLKHKQDTDKKLKVVEDNIDKSLDKMIGDWTEMFGDLKSQIDALKDTNLLLTTRVKSLETDLADLQQYIRRSSIEISGISENIQQSKL